MIHYKDLRYYVKLRPWVRNAWRVARQRRMRSGEYMVELRSGIKLWLRGASQDFTIFDRIFLRDEYCLRRYGKDAYGTVIDLGANVGIFTARVAPLAKRVICYEPMSGNFAQLQKNVGGLQNVEVVRAAVGGKEGVARIHYPRNERLSGGFSQFPSEALHQDDAFEEVPQVTLNQVFERHGVERCDLLKVDTEGAEYDILYAAWPETLNRVQLIVGEYHKVNGDDATKRIEALQQYLERLGFCVVLIPKRRLENHGLFFAERRAQP